MGAEISQPETSQSQPQPQPPPHEKSSREARPVPAQGEVNRAKAVEHTTVRKPIEIQYLTPREATGTTNRAKEVEDRTGAKASVLNPENRSKELKLPHNYKDILKHADTPIDKSSAKMYDKLYAGVFLDRKTKKYWLDKKSDGNCFMLYARALSITWAENQNYWRWLPLEDDAGGTLIEVAELKMVCWLEVHGRFDTGKLSPGILYEVSFLVMLKDPAEGWEVPVNVRLVLPGGKKQEHKENLIEKLRVRWIEIPVGQFVASAQDSGEMEFSMCEYEGGIWKQGLVIKGAVIKPKNEVTDRYKLPIE